MNYALLSLNTFERRVCVYEWVCVCVCVCSLAECLKIITSFYFIKNSLFQVFPDFLIFCLKLFKVQSLKMLTHSCLRDLSLAMGKY